ncbi:MAG: hypothetical protein ACMXX9_04635 [Candidatus Woesearchaeota archaeon]
MKNTKIDKNLIIILIIVIFGAHFSFEINNLKNENEKLIFELKNENKHTNNLEKKVIELENLVDDLNHTKKSLQEKLISKNNTIKIFEEKFNTSSTFYLPTKEKLKELVINSRISDNYYDLYSYNCVDFSNDLTKYLKENKIFSCRANVCFGDQSHSFVAVETTEGIVYIEPQTNYFFDSISVGDDYCKIVGWHCHRIINKFSNCY